MLGRRADKVHPLSLACITAPLPPPLTHRLFLATDFTGCAPLSISLCPQLAEGLAVVQGVMQPVMEAFDSVKEVIQMVAGFVIPPPGGTIAVAVFELASFAVKAMFNSQLCRELALKCAKLMQVICQDRDKLDKEKMAKVLAELDKTVEDIMVIVQTHAGKWGQVQVEGECRITQVCTRVWY